MALLERGRAEEGGRPVVEDGRVDPPVCCELLLHRFCNAQVGVGQPAVVSLVPGG